MNLSLPKQNPWGKVFLSWDRNNHADFVKELRAKLPNIGIELVSDSVTYDQFAAEEDANLKYFTLVLMTEDYVRSSACVTEFLRMYVKDTPWTIFYFKASERDEMYYRCDRYTDLAGAAINIPKSRRLEPFPSGDELMTRYTGHHMTMYQAFKISFDGSFRATLEPNKFDPDVKKNECAFIEMVVCQALQSMNPIVQVPFLQKIYCLLGEFDSESDSEPDSDYEDDEMGYLGIMGTGSCDRENMTLIAKTLSPTHAGQFPNTLFKYVEIIDPVGSGDDLRIWGVRLIGTLLGNTRGKTYPQLRNDFSNCKNNYLLVIDNLGHYDQLKELAKVFNFASPYSRVVFTTTNQDFFPKYVQWKTVVDDDSQLRLFYFKGKIPLHVKLAAESSSNSKSLKRQLTEEMDTMHLGITDEKLVRAKVKFLEQQARARREELDAEMEWILKRGAQKDKKKKAQKELQKERIGEMN